MGLFLANEVKSLYIGDKEVVEVYLGSEKIWPENKNLICIYNITEPGDTQICSSISNVQSIIVDGVSIDPVSTYNFEEAGEHTVEFVLTDDTLIDRMFSETIVKSVVIPNSVTSIGREAFCNCSQLINITIPNSMAVIGDLAFRNCFSLTLITCLATKSISVSLSAFRGASLSGVLTVPAGSNTGLESRVPGGWIVEYI